MFAASRPYTGVESWDENEERGDEFYQLRHKQFVFVFFFVTLHYSLFLLYFSLLNFHHKRQRWGIIG